MKILQTDISELFKNAYIKLGKRGESFGVTIFSFNRFVFSDDKYTDTTTVEVPYSTLNLPTDENITTTNNSHSLKQVQRTPSSISRASTCRERTSPIAGQSTSRLSLIRKI